MIQSMNRIASILCLLLIGIVAFTSCKSDSESKFAGNDILMGLEKDYNENPSPATANALLREVMQTITAPGTTDEKANEYLQYGYDVAKGQNIKSRQAAFLFPLIKNKVDAENKAARLFELAELMRGLKKETAANVLYKGIIDNHPGFEKVDEAQANLSTEIDTIDVYITNLGTRIFEDADNSGINRNASLAYVDACEAYALAYPDSEATPGNLFKAAEVAKSIRTYPKSLSLYDWILEDYPNYEKASTALFLKGFIIENSLGDDEKAREVYNEFLEKHPKHDLADDVEFLIENLGKSDEEILKMIESKRKENESK